MSCEQRRRGEAVRAEEECEWRRLRRESGGVQTEEESTVRAAEGAARATRAEEPEYCQRWREASL